ncbi:epoxide hydrolase 1 [Streptosporangium sp. NBC_01639]|uniref:epoxide hydrolase family protein n=1 Tax=unclassified Streptosporangium TaxID=2632669 RepID=UPI002DDAC55E|nr:alpha/beta fold hydrolase [Streptosporangium sp. NBC_01756]WSC89615.1 epoxide hydrolase 1 [Streptosporangium sp. NBC_01756]WTD51742.1 epoxide hydrolase 1 [Streptosporangium sp. NBC_01639]
MSSDITPFRIEIPQADLDDLQTRLDLARFTDEVPDAYGVSVERVRRLAEYWRDGYDWRAWEARLNTYPQFTTDIDGQRIHFIHVRSAKQDALPLILTHGWPGSIVEFIDVIEPLSKDFHLVIPSLPGFGFSSPITESGWGTVRTARAWAELMERLGYDRYGAVGNDGGSMVSPEIGRLATSNVVGVHVTQIFSFPSGDPAEFVGMTEEEQAAMGVLQRFWEEMGAFNTLQSQQPQTLAHALADSPVGLLGWQVQLFDLDLDDDFVLTNVAFYWLTGTAGSSIRFYYENAKAAPPPAEPTTTPIGLASAKGDFQSIRRFAERDHKNIVQWHTYETGGHYAAHAAPDVYAGDVRAFFSGLLQG